MAHPVLPPGFLVGTDFLNSSKRRKSERDYPIGTKKIREVAHILLITVVQSMLRYSQPEMSYEGRANSIQTNPALPYTVAPRNRLDLNSKSIPHVWDTHTIHTVLSLILPLIFITRFFSLSLVPTRVFLCTCFLFHGVLQPIIKTWPAEYFGLYIGF